MSLLCVLLGAAISLGTQYALMRRDRARRRRELMQRPWIRWAYGLDDRRKP